MPHRAKVRHALTARHCTLVRRQLQDYLPSDKKRNKSKTADSVSVSVFKVKQYSVFPLLVKIFVEMREI